MRTLSLLLGSFALIAAFDDCALYKHKNTCTFDVCRTSSGEYPDAYLMMQASGADFPFDAGDYQQCTEGTADVASYFLITGKGALNGSVFPIKVGWCAPSSCNETEIAVLFATSPLMVARLPRSLSLSDIVAKQAPVEQPWDTGAVLALLVLLLLLTLVLLATWCEVRAPMAAKTPQQGTVAIASIVTTSKLESGKGSLMARLLASTEEGLAVPHQPQPLLMHSCNGTIPSRDTESRQAPYRKFLSHFAALHNSSRLLAIAPSKPTDVLNGIRVISMLWIILGHTFFMPVSLPGYSNPLALISEQYGAKSTVALQMVLGAELAVDTFFFMSSFLFAWGMLSEYLPRSHGTIPIFLLYAKRWLRLTPVMAFWLLLYYKLTPHMGNGPFFREYVVSVNRRCDVSWWAQLLYIQNFYPWNSDDVCMGWTWYLGNDMVFYLLTPPLVLLFWRHRRGGWAALLLLLFGSFASTCLLTATQSYRGGRPGAYVFPVPGSLASHEFEAWFYWLYSKPWHRIPAWLVGLMAAYLWTPHEKRITGVLRERAWLSWLLLLSGCALLAVMTLLPIVDYVEPDSWAPGGPAIQLYFTFSHFLFAVGVALVCLPCFAAPECWLSRFLGHSAWTPLARITYGAYVVHPIVIKVLAANKWSMYRFEVPDLMYRALGNSVLAYGIAALTFLLVEKPFMNMEAALSGHKRGSSEPGPGSSSEPGPGCGG